MSENTTIGDVIAFIATRADKTDLDNIHNAGNARRRALRAIDAAAVKVGCQVTLDGLSPKYLNGLHGLVKSIDGGRCVVTLTPDSTNALRFSGRRFYIPAEVEQYDLGGIPTSCAKVGA